MSNFLKRKWRNAAISGFALALASDWTAKYFAGAATTTLARQAARLPTETNSHSLVHLSAIAEQVGLIFAVPAVVCWCIATHRREPGSAFWIVALLAMYGLSFFIQV